MFHSTDVSIRTHYIWTITAAEEYYSALEVQTDIEDDYWIKLHTTDEQREFDLTLTCYHQKGQIVH